MQRVKYQKLTPEILSDISGYEEALDYVFSDNDINNIAISGPFSAGKSSIIETYKTKHREKKILNISLANFSAEKDNASYSDEIVVNEIPNNSSLLERKIINQLIHQIDLKCVPLTNFKVKKRVELQNNLINSGITTYIVLLPILYNKRTVISNQISKLHDGAIKTVLEFFTSPEGILIAIFIYCCCVSYLIFNFFKFQLSKTLLKKMKIQGYEIEMFDKGESAYFDKHLNELIYIFDSGQIHSIVFEDIDRFDDASILFCKLRELNYLINKDNIEKNRSRVSNNKSNKIKFFYLIRDDVFDSKERTKFFDFIIPVVPVVDSSNSYEQIIDKFEKSSILGDFDPKFLKDISYYIDDMRLIKNIHNEYIIYKTMLNKVAIKLNNNNLLSLIIYKNMFPADFIKLQANQGFLYGLFEKKHNLIEQQLKEMTTKEEKLKRELQELDSEKLRSIEELDAVFLNFNELNIHGVDISTYKTRREVIASARQQDATIAINYNANGINIREFTKELENNAEYNRRKELIVNNGKNRIQVIQSELEKIKTEVRDIVHRELSKLLNRSNIDAYFKEVSNLKQETSIITNNYFDLIKYLVWNDHVNETYPDYLTYFYGKSLCLSDKNFIRKVKGKTGRDYNYELKECVKIVDELNRLNFDQEETLNFDLLDYLIENENEYSTRILNQIKKDKLFDFVTEYYLTTQLQSEFIKEICQEWTSFLNDLIQEERVSNIQKKSLIMCAVQNLEENDFIQQNKDGILTAYISDFVELEVIEPLEFNSFINNLKSIDIKFKVLNLSILPSRVLKAIYDNSLYGINIKMMQQILSILFGKIDYESYKHELFTVIHTLEDHSLYDYISNNINTFMIEYLNNCDELIHDLEDASKVIINNDAIDIDARRKYLNYINMEYSDISMLDNSLWEDVIKLEKVIVNAKNTFEYFRNYSGMIDSCLVFLINNNDGEFDSYRDEWKKKVNDAPAHRNLINSIISSKEINAEAIIFFADTYPFRLNKFVDTDIDSDLFSKLISLDLFSFNEENETFIRINYPEHILDFVSINIEEYINKYESAVTESDVEGLLLMNNLTDEAKLKLLSYYSGAISVKKRKFSTKVLEHVIKNNFIYEELTYLFEKYDENEQTIKDIILVQCSQNNSLLFDDKKACSLKLLEDIVESELFDEDYKLQLLLKEANGLDRNVVINLLKKIGMDDIVSIFEGKRPKLSNDDRNKKVLTLFKDKRWIKNYVEDNASGLFRVKMNSSFRVKVNSSQELL